MNLWVAILTFTTATLAPNAIAPAVDEGSAWLQLEYEKASSTVGGRSSGSSRGQQALVKTFIKATPEGIIFEYDYPRDDDGNSRSNFWYFPARLLERPDGRRELIDEPAIEARIENWLVQWKFPREACGQWSHGGGFPYKVDCDPQSILEQIEPFDLQIQGLSAGAKYSHSMGAEPGTLKVLKGSRSGYFVTVALDPSKARAEEVERALILSQMMGDDLSTEQARADAANIDFEGWITVEFNLNESGRVIRKTERSEIIIKRPGEPVEKTTGTITVTSLDIASGRERFGY